MCGALAESIKYLSISGLQETFDPINAFPTAGKIKKYDFGLDGTRVTNLTEKGIGIFNKLLRLCNV